MNRRVQKWIWLPAIAVTVLLGLTALYLGEVNQDEGWYLYSGRLVSEGRIPYADFMFTQGPVMCYTYAIAWPLVRLTGLAGGRLFTLGLGLAAAFSAAVLASRLAPRDRRSETGLLAFLLIGLNIYHAYFTTIVKTYALSALLLSGGFLAMTYLQRRRLWPAAIAGVLLAMAAGTRSSAVFALAGVGGVFAVAAWSGRRGSVEREAAGAWPSGAAIRALCWFSLAAVLMLLLLFLPLWLQAAEGLKFGLVEYHTGRSVPGFLSWIMHRAGFTARLVRAYYVAFGLFVALVLHLAWRGAKRESTYRITLTEAALWVTVLLISVVHAAAPFPYDDYQVMLFPLFAAARAGAVMRRCPKAWMGPLLVSVLILCLAAVFASERNQEWLVAGRDRIWWPLRKQSSLQKLQAAGAAIEAMSAQDDLLLTQDVYLAVEANRRVPPGMEMGPFSYFPRLSDAEAARLHVMNRRRLQLLLETASAPVAALSGWSFAIQLPSVTPVADEERAHFLELVRQRYQPVVSIEQFGQADTTLRILRRRAEAAVVVPDDELTQKPVTEHSTGGD